MNLLYEKILHLRATNRGTPRAYLFPRPSFEIAVLYLTVADMVAKPTTADVWTLTVLGGILALVAASSLLGLRTGATGTTSS